MKTKPSNKHSKQQQVLNAIFTHQTYLFVPWYSLLFIKFSFVFFRLHLVRVIILFFAICLLCISLFYVFRCCCHSCFIHFHTILVYSKLYLIFDVFHFCISNCINSCSISVLFTDSGDDIKNKIYDLWTKNTIPFNAYIDGIVKDFTTTTSTLDEIIMVQIDYFLYFCTKNSHCFYLNLSNGEIYFEDGNWECD